MSHSVFRDLDDDESSGNGARAEVADNNLIVFIHKDGGVQVDPNALQDLIVNANTDTKSTVSVIRVSSPTPSMETDEEGNSTKQSDGDDNENDSNNQSDEDNDDESKNSADSNEESDADGDGTEKRQQLNKKSKKKNKMPGFGLTVEEFYNPEQAVQFATEIMNIAGITNPKQLKADYEHLRYIIQNDHCYTPYTYADALIEANKSENATEATKRNDTKSKQKLSTTPAPNSTVRKVGRPSLKSTPSNGLDRDASNSARNRSVDDASSNENTADQNESDEEEVESETDFSDFTASDTDNDRDSDLDFSVNDCHSRRSAKKIKKRKLQAKKMAIKKRRRSTVDLTGSDADGATPKGKKLAKLPKKALNTSAKSASAVSPIVSSTSKLSPAATATPRLTKVSYVKESPQTTAHDNSPRTPTVQKTTSTITPQANPSSLSSTAAATASPSLSIDNKTKNINVKQKEKKGQSENVVNDMTSLFTPDVIKTNPTENSSGAYKSPIIVVNANKTPLSTPNVKVGPVSKPIIVQSISSQAATSRVITSTVSTTKMIRLPAVTFRRVVKAPAVTKLASEQDKQLDLINSLVQEELSKSKLDATTAPSSSVSSQTVVPAAIPNIVKMLETSESSSSIVSSDLTQPSSTSNTLPITYSTTQSTHDAQMLPDELLDSIVNSDYITDDLMQHVAKLVEDDKNLQEVIDQQMQNANSISPCTAPSHPIIQPIPVVSKPNVIHSEPSTPTKLPVEPKPAANVTKTPTTPLSATENKKGITVRRADGSVILLPPPEAPTTRGAKRRAEVIPSKETPQKLNMAKAIEQTDALEHQQKSVPNTPTAIELAKNSSSGGKQAAKQIAARERRASVVVKRASTDSKPRRSLSISNPPHNIGIGVGAAFAGADEDDDDEEDGSDASYNSEDDPHRLWCICRTPHNNRFMICCDKCEEWFHGQCVGITRQMGREMEQRKSEWICPNCQKKQQPSIKNIFPRKVVVENPPKMKGAGSSSTVTQSTIDSPAPNCIVCNAKQSRVNSVYCSDDCIRKHAKTTVTASSVNVSPGAATTSTANATETEASLSSPPFTLKSPNENEKKGPTHKVMQQLFMDKTNKVLVIDKTTNKLLVGKNRPSVDKLQQWLADNPNYEVLKPGSSAAMAYKAKQQQMKSLKAMADKELFSVSQPPPKVQTKLRFEADKMGYVNPSSQKSVSATASKRPHSATSSPGNSKSPHAHKSEPISKTPKLSSTPAQKSSTKKRTSNTPETKTPTSSKSESSSKSNNDREQLRENARKTLIEQLITRTKEITDPNMPRLTEVQITEFVNAAELEMFEMFGGDTNMKYKSKYRSLMYNIRDRKNLTLFEKISRKSIDPKQFVRMSTEELASQELAKWRENENKHQLEMITKSELDMLACGNSYVLKTHKGEEVIQESSERITLDPSIPVEDLVSVLNNTAVSSSDTSTTIKSGRVDKYLSSDGSKSSLSSSSKKDSERSHDKKDRHESRSSSGSSSKHKRKRSRERHSSHSGHSHSHKDKSHDKDKKERSSGSDSRKDKKDHKHSGSSSLSNSNRSKHHNDKDRKRESTSKPHSNAPKIAKTDENSIIDKILKAQSTIDSILHPEEFKKSNESTVVANVSSATTTTEGSSSSSSSSTTLTRQPSAANESDQEPTSTVTIPSPPEVTPETRSTTPPSLLAPIVWSGSISMVDVATFQVSLSPLSGSTAMIEFPREFDVVGRINPDTVWEYLDKIRISKDIVLLKFSPRSTSDDDETAYSTFINYLDTRKRLGVIKIPSKMVKDFYIMPLTSHKSLPSILKSTTGFDLGADRPDLLLGIVVRNRIPQTSHLPNPPKHRQPLIPFIGHKPQPPVTIPAKDAHYTPPSSPNMNMTNQVQSISKQVIKTTFSTNDDDEPYSPGGSDDDDLTLNTIPTSYLSSTSTNPIPDYAKSIGGSAALSSCDKQQLEELNRQIEAEKKEIAMHLQTVDIDEPYSPSSVSPPMGGTNISDVVSNISIPANLADILKNVASFGSASTQLSMHQYGANLMDTSDTEYVPVAPASSSINYAPASSQQIDVSSQPSKLAQLTDEELLRLVPDEI